MHCTDGSIDSIWAKSAAWGNFQRGVLLGCYDPRLRGSGPGAISNSNWRGRYRKSLASLEGRLKANGFVLGAMRLSSGRIVFTLRGAHSGPIIVSGATSIDISAVTGVKPKLKPAVSATVLKELKSMQEMVKFITKLQEEEDSDVKRDEVKAGPPSKGAAKDRLLGKGASKAGGKGKRNRRS